MEWAVGKQGEMMRPNSGKLMLPGSKIVWDIHYSNGGEDITDTVELGIYFYPKGQEPKFRQVLHLMGGTSGTGVSALGSGLDLPPNTVKATEGYFLLRENGRVESYQPHMHLRGKAMTMEAILPNGQTQVISHVADFNFNWHNTYVYKETAAPLLPKGTIIKVTAWHDNTTANKANPDPNVWVGYGDRTVDEMAHAWVNVTYMNDTDYRAAIEERRKAVGSTTTAAHSSSKRRTMRTHRFATVTMATAMVTACLVLIGEGQGSQTATWRRARRTGRQRRRTDLRHLRGLGAVEGRHQRAAARLLQSQPPADGRHPDRSREQHRARWSRLRPADALPDRPSVRHVRDHRSEGLGQQEAHLDHCRQRAQDAGDVLDEPAVLDRLLQERRERQRAAAHQVRDERYRVHRAAEAKRPSRR